MPRLTERHVRDHQDRPEWPPGAVIGGVDTHKHVHVAAVSDPLGRALASASFPTSIAGFKGLLRFFRSHGELAAVGIEGTGCWGGSLARWLAARDVRVIEVDRISDLRFADTGADSAALVYVGSPYRDEAGPAFVGLSSVYVMRDRKRRLALYQQTPADNS